MENETMETETPKNEEITEEVTEEVEETPKTLSEEEIAELKKKAKLADNYKIRAEKAEKKNKEQTPKEVKPIDTQELSTKDILYLSKTDIHEEDLDEVTKYASKNEVTVKEAHEYLKPILEVKVEQRKTAEATNTKGGARGGTTNTGDSLLEKAESTGEVPTTHVDMKKMAEARMARAKAKAKN